MTGRLWRGGMVFGGLMLLWGLASRSGIPHFLLPSPLAVAEALWVNRAYLGWHTLITLSEILSGLALGVTLGVTLALGILSIPAAARVSRANTLTWANRDFVLAARTIGASNS